PPGARVRATRHRGLHLRFLHHAVVQGAYLPVRLGGADPPRRRGGDGGAVPRRVRLRGGPRFRPEQLGGPGAVRGAVPPVGGARRHPPILAPLHRRPARRATAPRRIDHPPRLWGGSALRPRSRAVFHADGLTERHMSENNDAPTTEPTSTGGGDGGGTPAGFTQADVDRIVADRLARERAKYADYDDLKARAEQYTQAENAWTAERAKAEADYEELLGEKSRAEHELWRTAAAYKHGLPADLMEFLTGETAEEIDQRAETLASKLPAEPARTGPRPDPTQGQGADIPLNGDPLLADLKKKLSIP